MYEIGSRRDGADQNRAARLASPGRVRLLRSVMAIMIALRNAPHNKGIAEQASVAFFEEGVLQRSRPLRDWDVDGVHRQALDRLYPMDPIGARRQQAEHQQQRADFTDIFEVCSWVPRAGLAKCGARGDPSKPQAASALIR